MTIKYVMQYRQPDSTIWHDRDVEEDATDEGYKRMALSLFETASKFPNEILQVILRIELPVPLESQQENHDKS